MRIEDLLVSAEEIKTGKRIVGYVCGCKDCIDMASNEKCDSSRPVGLLTHPELLYGGVSVYTDNMEFVKSAN